MVAYDAFDAAKRGKTLSARDGASWEAGVEDGLEDGYDPDAEDAASDVDEEEVRSVTSAALDAALDWRDELDDERVDNLDRYLGRPYGNEKLGFSQVVDRAVLDTIEWIMPNLLEVFHGSDEVGQFDPQEEAESEQAEQATDYVNYVYNRDNPGFLISHAVIKDALIQRLGVWRTVWEEKVEISASEHEGLSEAEALMLLDEEGVTLERVAQRIDKRLLAQAQATAQRLREAGIAAPIDPEREATVYDLRITKTTRGGRVAVEAVPPDEYVYSADARRADVVNFEAQVRQCPRADLIALGYDEDAVKAIPADGEVDDRRVRRWSPDTGWSPPGAAQVHESMELVTWAECYIRADFDGDGIAEQRKVVLAGPATGRVLMHQEMIDERVFTPVSPILMSHRLEGLSVVELIKDIQAVRTEITRQMLDNLFEVNNVSRKVKRTAHADTWQAVLNWYPGRPIPVGDPDDVTWEAPQWNGGQAFPFLEYLDRKLEGRSGVSATSTGLNPDLLKQQTLGAVAKLMTMANQRVQLLARVLAETGFKPLFNRILRLLVKHQDKPRMMKLRGRWVAMDPRAWNAGMDFIPDVGLGTGDKSEIRVAMGEVLAIQEKLKAHPDPQIAGMVAPKNIYNALKQSVRGAGLKSVEPYFTDPDSIQPQPPQPPNPMADPMVVATVEGEKIKAAAALQKAKMDDDFRRDELAQKREIEFGKLGAEIDAAALKSEQDAWRDAYGVAQPGMAPAGAAGGDPAAPGASQGGGVQGMPATPQALMAMLMELRALITAPRAIIRDEEGRVAGSRVVMEGM
jgi:hypothetical protein